ncbi:MAG TPA: hypothetical protein EYP10_09585, partial [Armatimonadetes bacterium]|nr:hypothetical protein [Armatimonadota bacterium]
RQHWSTYGRLDMPWVGVTDGTKGYMLLWEDPDDGMCVFDAFATPIGKVLAPVAFHEPCMRKFSYARRIRYCFVHKGGYVAICKRYRAYAKAHGLLVTLREKMKRKPALKYLAGAPDVWGADGVGGIKFCREAKALGIDRMIVNGDWSPQIAREMMSLGYLVSRYDNYEDIIEGGRPPYGDCKIPDDAPLRADGKRQLGWLTWDKKRQFYKRCSLLQLPVARRFIPNHLRKSPHNAWFIDVTTATWLIECYDSKHRHTRTRDRKAKRALAKFVSDELGLVLGGEHGRWWGVDIYDYWEGMMSGGFYSWPAGHVGINLPKRREEIGKRYIEWGIGHKHRLPLWELTFGDCVVSTWYWGDSTGHLYRAAPEIAAKKDAFNILYATVPLYWVNRAFGFNWSDPKLRERLLESYRITCKLHEQIGFEEMLTHEYVTPDKDVQRTVFESGTEVIVNFGKKPFALVRDGRKFTLPQFGFYAHGPKVFQYRALAGDRSITFIQTPTYAFCDANGKVHDFGICVTDGQVTMRVEGTE